MTTPLTFITRVTPTRPQAPAAPAGVTLSLQQEPAAPLHEEVAELAPLPDVATVLGPRNPMVRLGRLSSGIGSLAIHTGSSVEATSVAWEAVNGRSGSLGDAPMDRSRRAVVDTSKDGETVLVGLRWAHDLRRVLIAVGGEVAATVRAPLLAPLRVDPRVRVIEVYFDDGDIVLRASTAPATSWADYDIVV